MKILGENILNFGTNNFLSTILSTHRPVMYRITNESENGPNK